MARRKPSCPDYGAAHKMSVALHRAVTKEGCEICHSKAKLYVYIGRRTKRLRCACRKHLRKVN